MPRQRWMTPRNVQRWCGISGPVPYEALKELAEERMIVREVRLDYRGFKRVGYCRP